MIEEMLQEQNTHEVGFLQSCKLIFGITFRQSMRSKKTIFILLLTILPAILAVFYRIFQSRTAMSPQNALMAIMMFYLQFVSVLVALFYATALVADEVDNKTITYLFTRPIRKYSIILGKFAAYIVEVLLIIVPPILITFVIVVANSGISGDLSPVLSMFFKRLGVIILGLITYGAIFTYCGVRWRRPVLIGLVFAFGWEKVVIVVPGALRKFSVVHYLMSAFPGIDMPRMNIPRQLFPSISASLSIIILIAITFAFIILSIFSFQRREYKTE